MNITLTNSKSVKSVVPKHFRAITLNDTEQQCGSAVPPKNRVLPQGQFTPLRQPLG